MRKPAIIYNWFLSGATVDPVFEDLLLEYNFTGPQPDVITHPSSTNDYDDLLYGYTSQNVPGGNLVDGITGKALSLTVNTNYYTKPRNLTPITFNTAGVDRAFTVEIWAKLVTGGANRWVFGKRAAAADREYDSDIDTSNRLQFSLYTAGGVTNYIRIRTVGSLTVGQWYQIVYVYDGSETVGGLKIYLNGVEQSVTNQSLGSYTGMTTYPNSPLTLGNIAPGSTSAFQGQFDSFKIWNRALSASEVTNIYNSGTPKYSRTNPYNYFEGKYKIIHRLDNYIFASDGSNLLWSEDAGQTYYTKAWGTQYSAGLPIHDRAVTCANIFDNGDVMFATAKTVYYSTDGLVNINTSAVQDKNGNPYVFHTPNTATRPGAYFYQLNKPNEKMYVGGSEVFVWTNYTNSGVILGLGASPTVVWATFDNGQTVREVYTFGQNTLYRDNGSAGGANTGTLLGDAANTRITRHGHSLAKVVGSDVWYSVFGDANANDEVHWLRHSYSAGVWTTTEVLIDAIENTRWKVGKLHFTSPTEIYFSSDATSAPSAAEEGLHVTTIANIGVSSTKLVNITGSAGSLELTDFYISPNTNKILINAFGPNYLNRFYLSDSVGNYEEFIVPETAVTAVLGWVQLENGYFHMLCSAYNAHKKTLWIKDL